MKELLSSKIFWLGLIIRLAILPLWTSSHLTDLFIPFVDEFITHPLSNPWSVFPNHYFPYGTVLLLLLSIPKAIGFLIFGNAALGTSVLSLILIKVPLLVLDILFLRELLFFCKQQAHRLLFLYWLNPIVIFITYAHGQLDIASIYLVFVSLRLLVSKKHTTSAIAFAGATLCKFHVVCLIPFMLAYVWNREFRKQATKKVSSWIFVWFLLTALGFIPLLKSSGTLLYVTAGSPEGMRIFAGQFNLGEHQVLYVGIAIVIAVIARLSVSSRINEQGLLYGCGAILGSLVLTTRAAPGWYFWITPFLSCFYAVFSHTKKSLFVSFIFCYLVCFLILGDLKIVPSERMANLVFTLLQTSLVINLFAMWIFSIKHECPLMGRVKPLLIGVAGDSSSGKNFFTHLLQEILNKDLSAIVEGDDYHKWERAHTKWQDYTHLHPRANHLHSLLAHIRDLSRGKPVFQPHYDHSNGKFTEAREIKPGRTIVIQGLHTFHSREMRKWMDIKIFLNPDDKIRLAWKIRRDVTERGHSMEKVVETLKKRMSDAQTHILPQGNEADWIISYFPLNEISVDEIIAGKAPQLATRHVFQSDAPVWEVIESLRNIDACSVKIEDAFESKNKIQVTISGDLSREQIENIANQVFPNLRSYTRGTKPPQWKEGLDGINQLLAISFMKAILNS